MQHETPKFSASRLLKWIGHRIERVVDPKKGDYVFLTPPFLARQAIRNRRTGAKHFFRIRNKSDLSITKQIYLSEDYSIAPLRRAVDIKARYEALVSEGKTPLIIDCGGNIGLSAKYFAEHYPKAKIVVIEPETDNFTTLKDNCTEAGIIPMRAAIAGKTGKGKAVDVGRGASGIVVEPDPDGDLAFITVHQLLEEHGGSDTAPFIFKADIEGFEADLFAGETDWLDAFYLLVVELHDWMLPGEARSQSFLEAVAPLGRDFIHINENIFSISNTRPETPQDRKISTHAPSV